MFSGAELAHFISQATWVTVNDYEWQLLQQKTAGAWASSRSAWPRSS